MASIQRYTKLQVMDAIRGSAGIKVVICERLKCDKMTLENYIKRYPDLKDVIQQEREARLDMAEILILQNIRYQRQVQQATEAPVDSSDAWKLLDKLGWRRGYGVQTGLGGMPGIEDAKRVTIREVVVELPNGGEGYGPQPILGEDDVDASVVDVPDAEEE